MQKTFYFLIDKRRLLLLALLLNALLHFPFLNMPPNSIHVWRQCNTLAVARNFSEESMNILKPRVDRRLETDGVTGMQFPAYEWITACGYKVFGENFFVARIFSMLFFSLAIIAFYFLIIETTSSALAAAIGAWSFCWSPELFYHGINALPDILALSSGLAAALFFMRWRRNNKTMEFIFSMVLMTLAGLVKLQYLMFGGFIAAYVLIDFSKSKNSIQYLKLLIYATVCITTPLIWYSYANGLIEKSNLRDFVIEMRPEKDFTKAIHIIKNNLISDLPELLLNFAGTALVLIACFSFFKYKKWKHKLFLPLLFTTLIYIAYHLIELHQMDVHHYYMLPAFLVLTFIMSFGGKFLADKKMYALLLLILFAQPLLAAIRILPARWLNKNKAVAEELYNASSCKQLQQAVSDNSLVLAGPDESGCIYFYFLHKKGFGYDTNESLKKLQPNNKIYLQDCISRGAKYIYTGDSTIFNDTQLKPYFDKEISSVGKFKVYLLKQ